MTAAPILTTARLTLRPFTLADYPAFAACLQSPRACGMGGPFDSFGAWSLFCHDVAGWALYGHGGLAITHSVDGVVMGEIVLNAGPLFPEPELGWTLYDGFEGQGYATEAAAALRDWAFAQLPYPSLVSYCDADNLASQAVALRLGAVPDADAPRPDPSDLVFRHRRPA